MSSGVTEFDRCISEIEEAISFALPGSSEDERVTVLRDLLISQVRVCSLHYRLMQLEEGDSFRLNDEAFSKILSEYTKLLGYFMELHRSEEKPSYEMRSILTLYRFLVQHYQDGQQ